MRYSYTPLFSVLKNYARGMVKVKIKKEKLKIDGELNHDDVFFLVNEDGQRPEQIVDAMIKTTDEIINQISSYPSPRLNDGLSEKDPDYVASFKQLKNFLITLKTAFLAGELEKAGQLIFEINQLKQDSHDQYKPDDKN